MALSSFTTAFRGFWHTMTSADRHASQDSPYRTGRHVPLSQNRNAPLSSVATDAADSQVDLVAANSGPSNDAANAANPYFDRNASPGDGASTPYTPGSRSAMQRNNSGESGLSRKDSAEVPMQTFSDGLPPPPPVKHSWKRIDRWTEEHYEELWDNTGEPATLNDINELEHQLDCTLPQDVRDSLQIHDGQERGGLPTGIIFGCMLLDCEEIVDEWTNWRRVTDEILNKAPPYESATVTPKSMAGPSTQSVPASAQQANWREELLARQDSQPSGAVLKAYTHPAWIPMARDWGGNLLAVDLAPGPTGKWGQVIIFGRDYDCKYVVARSWGAFLATVADDMGTSKVFVHEESGELKLREFKQQDVEPAYIDILRWRADQKYGRKPPRRPSNSERRMHPNAAAHIARGNSFTSPTMVDGAPDSSPGPSTKDGRGRSPHRFNGKHGATSSPRGVSSPLARVAESEEGDAAAAAAAAAAAVAAGPSTPSSRKTSLAQTDRPAASASEPTEASGALAKESVVEEDQGPATNGTEATAKPSATSKDAADGKLQGLGVELVPGKSKEDSGAKVNGVADGDDEMKTVEI